jgi:hypothetical protein
MKNILQLSQIIALIFTFACSEGQKNAISVDTKNQETIGNLKYNEVENTLTETKTEPSSILEKDYENPKLTLLYLIKSEPFNPNGYMLFRYGENDKYGNQGAPENELTIILTESQVAEIKKYKDVFIFWDSDYGKYIVNLMIDCFKRNELICDCRKK